MTTTRVTNAPADPSIPGASGFEATFTIGEVSGLTGLTTHTVRFYEKEGLFFGPVRRNSAGRRVFTDFELQWCRDCAVAALDHPWHGSVTPVTDGDLEPEIGEITEAVVQGAKDPTEQARLLEG